MDNLISDCEKLDIEKEIGDKFKEVKVMSPEVYGTVGDVVQNLNREMISEVRNESFYKGKAQGRAEGKAEGMAEGEAIGRSEANLETARILLTEGVDEVIICNSTGISIKELEKLKKEI